ncbi:MAG: EVE domain-containing protein [Desulfuromonadaceae bacterium GWC2_58_13]|nr:MAG: EVE domain-containing protein [Desulfuromonadaceae bacterium GWC2_58_13]
MTNFWLMKSEPDCFSYQDLVNAPGKISSWDGVRNYQARNLLRDVVRIGDGVLFYHSNLADPAIVGVARVVTNGYPDHTALDPRSAHFDPKATEQDPIWYMVDVQAVSALPHPVTRSMLKSHPGLFDLDVLKRGNRLSVQPVSACHWSLILLMGGMLVDPIQRRCVPQPEPTQRRQ